MAITKVTTDVITDLAVTAPKLAADSVITAKIADNAVTAAKIAAGALGDQVAGISSSASATTIAGTLASTGVLTANAGVVVDNITIDGTEIDLSSGDLTLDVAGDIILDADGGDIQLKDGGSTFGLLSNDNFTLKIQNHAQDTDISFIGNDGGSLITALTLDMSTGGTAYFADDVRLTDNHAIRLGTDGDIVFYHDNSNGHLESAGNFTLNVAGDIILDADGGDFRFKDAGTQQFIIDLDDSVNSVILRTNTDDGDMIFQGNDGGSNITALTLDMSEAGAATFNGNVGIGGAPGAKLDVNSGTTNTMAHFHTTDDNGFIELKDDDTTAYIGVQDDYMYIGGAASRNAQNLVINDGNGNVGIGTTSPASGLHLTGADNTASKLTLTNTAPSPDNTWSLHPIYNGQNLLLQEDGATRVTFKEGGSVGIGTTDPAQKLEILDTSTAKTRFAYSSAIYGEIGRKSDGNYEFSAYENGANILFGTSTTNGATTTRMRIDSSGRVGINRAPSKSNSKLEVGGADNVGLIHVEASGNFASWGIGSNQSKFYYNDTQMMGLTNEGVMRLMGGNTGGRQDLLFNNGAMSLADNAAYTFSGIANTGCLIAIGQQRSNVGVTYDHCLIFVETGTNAVAVANPSGRFSINTSGTDTVTNVYVSGGSVVLENKVGTTNYYSFACFVFQGN